MNHYDYPTRLHELWGKAVALYGDGKRGASTFFADAEREWLLANGMTPQEIYDFAEDVSNYGEPDFTTFAMVTDIRRSFFLHRLGGKHSETKIDSSTYPAKSDEVDGIPWLPRLIEKAKAKLHGQLDDDTMYGCGGDRRFFKDHNIHPAEFLAVVRDNLDNDRAVIEFAKSRGERTLNRALSQGESQ